MSGGLEFDPALMAALGLGPEPSAPPLLAPDVVSLFTPPVDVDDAEGPGVIVIREDTEADARLSLATFAGILDAAEWWLDEPNAWDDERDLLATLRRLRAALGLPD